MQNQGRILAVDDTPANLNVISDTLRKAGYSVATAIDGERALKRLEHYQPDLILLDVMLPGIDGFETCTRLKANPQFRHIPIIFLTALSEPINRTQGLNLGGVDYITKPFETIEFLSRIRVHLNLQRAQLQLLQEANLSTLGNLVNGIVHEVNNPINFVARNINPVEQHHQELVYLLELYEAQYPDPPDEIKAWRQQINLPHLKRDSLNLLKSIRLGAERLQDILSSLRTLSPLDTTPLQTEWGGIDLQRSLDHALLLLSYRLQANTQRPAINVIKQYAELPEFQGHSAQLSQALMQVLMNGIDALQAKDWTPEQQQQPTFPTTKIERPQLTLTTTAQRFEQNPQILLQIMDNGVGISAEIQPRIFERFFSTKPLGQGIGLGLAIAHQIITEQHGGTITCTSELGKGTTVTIALPLAED
ncbi:MAG: hybrid sensor histidine kinase/response regulator [Cyanobacteria bacterium P01_G01_bin.54]